MTRLTLVTLAVAATLPASPLQAQERLLVYRLGADTVALEQYTRSATRLTGEMVTRSGASVTRTAYQLQLAGGRVTAAVVRRMQADGSPLPNAPVEYRLAFGADSVRSTMVWKDSTSSRTVAARNAFPALPVFVYAPFEVLNAAGPGLRDSVPAVGLAGNALGFLGLERLGGDTLRLRGAPYPMRLRFGGDGDLLLVDGSLTTNKAVATPAAGRVDLAAMAQAMRPTGVLSPRMAAQATIGQGPIMISYGSPAVRGRTVWGGTLVPYDSIWRAGANEATHLATSKTLQLGGMTLPPGVYSLWIQHTRTGTWLIVNRQVGQWGTIYDPANDIGRVAMELSPAPEFAEDLRVAIRPLPQGRGVIEFTWGDRTASAGFAVRP